MANLLEKLFIIFYDWLDQRLYCCFEKECFDILKKEEEDEEKTLTILRIHDDFKIRIFFNIFLSDNKIDPML